MVPLKYLDISTAHVTRETMDQASLNPYFIAEYEYGAFFYVPDGEDIAEDTRPDLAAVLQFAKDNDCTLVRFDCDGGSFAELETYDW